VAAGAFLVAAGGALLGATVLLLADGFAAGAVFFTAGLDPAGLAAVFVAVLAAGFVAAFTGFAAAGAFFAGAAFFAAVSDLAGAVFLAAGLAGAAAFTVFLLAVFFVVGILLTVFLDLDF
jgi:hypothetical protein